MIRARTPPEREGLAERLQRSTFRINKKQRLLVHTETMRSTFTRDDTPVRTTRDEKKWTRPPSRSRLSHPPIRIGLVRPPPAASTSLDAGLSRLARALSRCPRRISTSSRRPRVNPLPRTSRPAGCTWTRRLVSGAVSITPRLPPSGTRARAATARSPRPSRTPASPARTWTAPRGGAWTRLSKPAPRATRDSTSTGPNANAPSDPACRSTPRTSTSSPTKTPASTGRAAACPGSTTTTTNASTTTRSSSRPGRPRASTRAPAATP